MARLHEIRLSLKMEKRELDEKLTRLDSLLSDKDKAVESVGQEQYDLLVDQAGFMRGYSETLRRRIQRLDKQIG